MLELVNDLSPLCLNTQGKGKGNGMVIGKDNCHSPHLYLLVLEGQTQEMYNLL